MDKLEYLKNVLRAECDGEDLHICPSTGDLLILSKDENGKYYELGFISQSLLYSGDREAIWSCINQIKFGKRRFD